MKILLLHAYSTANKGDAAILSVMIKQLKVQFAHTELRISTLDTVPDGATFEGVPLHSGLFHAIIYAPTAAFRRICNILLAFLGIYPKAAQKFFEDLAWADKIIGVGGGYINGRKGIKSTVSLWLTLLEFSVALKKHQIALFPQSIGPFGNRFQEFLAKRTLNRFSLIMVRERISLEVLKQLGVSKPNIEFAPDLAFDFISDRKAAMRTYLEKLGIDFTRPIVGITVRQWFKGADQESYERAIAQFTDWLVLHKNMQVVFIPQVTSSLHHDDDREVQKRIMTHVQAQASIWSLQEAYDHYDIKGLYENMNFVVGTRMHSVIFALTGQVLALAIAYEHKTKGVMQELGLERQVIDINDLSFGVLRDHFEILEKQS